MGPPALAAASWSAAARRFFWGTLGALCACALTFGAPPAAESLSWIAVHSPHFTVLTVGDVKGAEHWAADLERFRVGIGEIIPVNPKRLTPVMVVIFPNEKLFRPFKLLQNGKPAEIGGYLARTDYVSAIGLARDANPVETRRTIFHEATHWYSSARDEHLPVWLEEGVAEVFSTFVANEKEFMVGDAVPEHVRYLRDVQLPSLAMVTNLSQDRIRYNDRFRTGQFYATSWLFAHWAMYGDHSPGSQSLRRYVDELHRGTLPDEAFLRAFGGNYDAVRRQLKAYLSGGKYVRKIYTLPPDAVKIEPPNSASPTEVNYALGTLLLVGQGPKNAMPYFQRTVQLSPSDPRGWEALAFAHLSLGKNVEALEAFDRAALAGSRLAVVWHNRAALRQEAELGADFVRTSDHSVFTSVAADYRQAIDLDPLCQMAYEGLAGVVYGVEPFDPTDLVRLAQGRRAFPDNLCIAVGHAAAQLRTADAKAGEAELRTVLRNSDRLPQKVRRLAESALEGEKLKQLSEFVELSNREQNYSELVLELDAALADTSLSLQNRQIVQAMRKEADQLRRIKSAVTAYNSGKSVEAILLLRSVLDERPATGVLRIETERLLKQISSAPSDDSKTTSERS